MIVFGGFGYKTQHLNAVMQPYRGIQKWTETESPAGTVLGYNFSVPEMTMPELAPHVARDVVLGLKRYIYPKTRIGLHCVSGSWWMMHLILDTLRQEGYKPSLRSLVLDCSPPTCHADAFAGWGSFALRRPWLKTSLYGPANLYRRMVGITDEWERSAQQLEFNGKFSVFDAPMRVTMIQANNDPVVCPTHQVHVADEARRAGHIVRVIHTNSRHGAVSKDDPDLLKECARSSLTALIPTSS